MVFFGMKDNDPHFSKLLRKSSVKKNRSSGPFLYSNDQTDRSLTDFACGIGIKTFVG